MKEKVDIKKVLYQLLITLLIVPFIVSTPLADDSTGGQQSVIPEAMKIDTIDGQIIDIITLLQVSAGMPVDISSSRMEDYTHDGLLGLHEAIARFRGKSIDRNPQNIRRSALRSADSCTSLTNRFRLAVIEDMKQKLADNLKWILEWRNWLAENESHYYGCYDCPIGIGYELDYMILSDSPGVVIGGPPMWNEKENQTEEPEQSSDTNVQVKGVDEADFMKNIGQCPEPIFHG
ncbi:secreted protein [Candidatus Magnetomorum sp. HK-1]|nr:secreted protein [Candidatus Magnetomorum sp. HK-1]